MKRVIENICKLLADGAFKDEQHVRFSLVGRICQALGWNIWNPDEFHTEFKVKRLPQQNITKDVTGRVDIALFIPEKTSEGAEVFIEVKTPGKLDSSLISGETQLHLYNAYHKSAISILTDGIKWRFYLPSAGGEFEDKLFNEINILDDDPDDIAQTFEMILRKDNYRKKALNTAENMRDELVRIKLIGNVKTEAIAMHEKTDLSPYMFAQQLIKKNHKLDIDIEDIQRLWDRKQSGIKKAIIIDASVNPNPSNHSELLRENSQPEYKDYTGTKPIRLCVLGIWHQVNSWRDVKRITYNALLSNLINAKISKWYGVSQDKGIYSNPISLDQEFYTEGCLKTNNVIKHCMKALVVSGLKPDNDWTVQAIDQKQDGKATD